MVSTWTSTPSCRMNEPTLEINGWSIYAHSLFLDQLEGLIDQVAAAKTKNPSTYKTTRAAKLLAAVLKLALEDIPSDPTRSVYRQGNTLGGDRQHWFRAKFLQQFRLFFRYHQSKTAKVIILAWVNDDDTLRAYGSKTDAYETFRKMLERGNPPDDWETLLGAVQVGAGREGLAPLLQRIVD